jgi:hypothetical protein
MDADFEEAKHPRGEFGQFTSGSSAGGTGYGSSLKSAYLDSAKFDELIAKLRSDKSITKEKMRDIAKEVLGREPRSSSKSREDLLNEMVKWQFLDARRLARGANI